MENRSVHYEILDEIKNRWSPRAFSKEELSIEDIFGVLEAARFAPSCFNEQPWRFILAISEEDREKMMLVLTEQNKLWAINAPVLILIVSKNKFDSSDKENRWSSFDSGTAWGYLSLEAQRRGLITHAMGGFSVERAKESYKLGDNYTPMAVIALGRYGDVESLNDDLKKREHPSSRKETAELLFKSGGK
jgi:nitroreductase